jgi:flagellar basal body rod protein FlgC
MVSGISAINIAVSGFDAATNRINVSANNIANEFSTRTDQNGTVTNTPYAPQQAVDTSLTTGGVISSTQPVTPATISVYDPVALNADSNGIAQLPNVDPAHQLVNTDIATYGAQANLKVLKAATETLQEVLNIIT